MNGNDGTNESRKAARDALLDAITESVAEIMSDGGGPNAKLPRLKLAAEAYALVIHGNND